jgi:hypothetical protein
MISGVVFLSGSLLADGIGIGGGPGLGVLQIVGAALGLVVFLVGFWLFFKRKSW